MENYIQSEKGSPTTCSHSMVERVHEWGGAVSGGSMIHHVTLTFKDGTTADFGSNGKASIYKANQYLNLLTDANKRD